MGLQGCRGFWGFGTQQLLELQGKRAEADDRAKRLLQDGARLFTEQAALMKALDTPETKFKELEKKFAKSMTDKDQIKEDKIAELKGEHGEMELSQDENRNAERNPVKHSLKEPVSDRFKGTLKGTP